MQKSEQLQTQYLTLPEGKIAYDVRGEGPLLLCLPGIFDMRSEYRFLVPLLAQAGYRVVTMDWRGLGETSARWPSYAPQDISGDILAMIRHFGDEPAYLVAHSYNSASSVILADTHPEAVRAMALHGPFVRDHMPAWMAHPMNEILYARPWGLALWKWYYSTSFPVNKPADFDEYFAAQMAMLREPGRLRAMRHLTAFAAAQAKLGEVKTPTLILVGERDRDYKPQAEAEWIQAHIPGSKAQMIADAGHYLVAQVPEVASQAIIGFFQSLPSSR